MYLVVEQTYFLSNFPQFDQFISSFLMYLFPIQDVLQDQNISIVIALKFHGLHFAQP